MIKVDATKYLRQMKYLPNITPFSNILLIIIICMYVVSPRYHLGTSRDSVKMKYAHYQLQERWAPGLVNLVVFKSGEVTFLGAENVFQIKKFDKIFQESLNNGFIVNPKKIRIHADGDVSWGAIAEVLKFAKARGITVAGFMMAGEYSILHYWEMENIYREKGLGSPIRN